MLPITPTTRDCSRSWKDGVQLNRARTLMSLVCYCSHSVWGSVEAVWLCEMSERISNGEGQLPRDGTVWLPMCKGQSAAQWSPSALVKNVARSLKTLAQALFLPCSAWRVWRCEGVGSPVQSCWISDGRLFSSNLPTASRVAWRFGPFCLRMELKGHSET